MAIGKGLQGAGWGTWCQFRPYELYPVAELWIVCTGMHPIPYDDNIPYWGAVIPDACQAVRRLAGYDLYRVPPWAEQSARILPSLHKAPITCIAGGGLNMWAALRKVAARWALESLRFGF